MRVGDGCIFCGIADGAKPASIVCEDDLTIAFVDLRQFHPGHVLIIPRQHLHDVRELAGPSGASFISIMSRVTRAVGAAFPNQGLSLWHSIGEAAFQEVPHLHFHVHPRLLGDDVLRVYPKAPLTPDRSVLDSYAAAIRMHL